MGKVIPCVLMRAGTSRGPFFLREWLPEDDEARDQALIGAIGASDPLQLDGVGGGSTLNSKVAIVSRSTQPGCDLDYLFAQVGVGHRSVDTRPNCGNMLSGVAPFAIEQGLIPAQDGTTSVRVYNVNTGSRIDVTVRTPGGRVTYEGDARIDGVAGTAAPVLLNFLDAWGAVTGQVFPTGKRIDTIDGVEVTCIDAAMPLMIVRAGDLGLTGREKPAALDANTALLERLEALRLQAGRMMSLGDVSNSVIPKPVLVSPGDSPNSVTSRYFTPRRCHASHAVTGAIGVASAVALPGTVATASARDPGRHALVVLHPAGQIDVEVELKGSGDGATVERAALVRTVRKIMQGELHLPEYVFSRPEVTGKPASEFPRKAVTIIVPTRAGGGNDVMARIIAAKLSPLLGCEVLVDNRAGANGAIASEYVAHAAPDGHTLLFGYVGTHAMNPALQKVGYDPVADFAPIGMVGSSPTIMVGHPEKGPANVTALIAGLKDAPRRFACASAGDGTPPYFAAELFQLSTHTAMASATYEGAAPAIADTVAGRAQIMFPSLFTAHPFIRAGQLQALAVTGPKRLTGLPGVPTLAEVGVTGVDVAQWYGLFAPAGTSEEVVCKLNRLLNEVLADPEVVERFQSHGAQVEPGTPDALLSRVETEVARWSKVVKQAGLAPSEPRLVTSD
ncbi:4-oxalomesaconate tautomerase [Ramlibacter ginsenosidimutans]|uniref:4-oxalomesaconate tautomerase n=1 Tax=Ramlibacter ginsenosidimutans TaxID=502333 RepID=A0A934TUK8_9BURK|nr:4-oxalomesaconate tautomerase [Ramlibacter ginsenosidimutans]MBK6007165.1 4-oxalomesaconate tautomerase [Ramlibacter ginsenosidimutans]